MAKKRSDGEGAVYQVHAKDCPRPTRGCKCMWRGAVVTGWKTGENGKRTAIRKTVTASTRSGCAVKVRELNEKLSAHTLPVGKVPTLEQWLNYCHARLLPGKIKESSLVAYRTYMVQYLIPLLGHIRLDKLTADDIEDAWHTLLEVGNPLKADPTPLAPSTVHQAHVVLRRMLRLAVQRKRLAANPAGPDSMDAPPRGKGEVEPIPTEDWRKVLDVAPAVPNSARYTVALAIGLRQGEALGLRWSDIDLTTGLLRVRQIVYRLPKKGLLFGTPKTDQSRREIVLPESLTVDLRHHRKDQAAVRLHAGDQWEDNDLVFPNAFGRPIDPSDDRRRWKALMVKAGAQPVKLHAARHTAATMLLLEGVDPRVVMDIMGWSQISTAANYQHAVAEAKKVAAGKIDAAIWG